MKEGDGANVLYPSFPAAYDLGSGRHSYSAFCTRGSGGWSRSVG
jgi:hypothetical protein